MKKLIMAVLIASLLFNVAAVKPVAKESVSLPKNIIKVIDKYSEKYGVDRYLIMAIVWHESRGKTKASNGSYKGLMQLSSKYFKGDLYNADNNVKQGTKHLLKLFEKYHETHLVISCFGYGEGGAKKYIKSNKQSKLAKDIMRLQEQFQDKYEVYVLCEIK